jgi:endonuclease/exonuclease/phosphatase family metal-dependent hydrolase
MATCGCSAAPFLITNSRIVLTHRTFCSRFGHRRIGDYVTMAIMTNAKAQSLRPVVAAVILMASSSCGTTTRMPATPEFLAKSSDAVVRLLTWNVGRDSVFADGSSESSRYEQFARVIRATKPDIVCLQEVWRGSGSAASLFDQLLPQPDGRRWQHHGVLDNVIVSRLDLSLLGEGTIDVEEDRKRGHATALARRADATSLYLICGHFQSRDRASSRERHADAIATLIYARQSDGTVPSRTPVVVLGDLNAIATLPASFVANLRAGRIGGDTPPSGRGPDWNGSGLEDAAPRHNGRGQEMWTWRNDRTKFPAGALDRVLYTGSVMVLDHAFILNTTTMTADELRNGNLLRNDTMLNAAEGIHDHLPVVVDFVTLRNRR